MVHKNQTKIFLFSLVALNLFTCQCSAGQEVAKQGKSSDATIKSSFVYDRKTAAQDLQFLTQKGHVFGSEQQEKVSKYLLERLLQVGAKGQLAAFKAQTPNPAHLPRGSKEGPLTLEKQGFNIFAVAKKGATNCLVLLGGHYDTKRVAGGDYVGANDSGSSTVGLLQIARNLSHLGKSQSACSIGILFFDGEESVLESWYDGEQKHPARIKDHLYGSRHLAASLAPCALGLCLPKELGGYSLRGLILLDMIGSKETRLTMDTNSDEVYKQMARGLDKLLFAKSIIHPSLQLNIQDDHIPFLERSIPAINLIDFASLEHWHKLSDIETHVSHDSIEKVSTLAYELALIIAK